MSRCVCHGAAFDASPCAADDGVGFGPQVRSDGSRRPRSRVDGAWLCAGVQACCGVPRAAFTDGFAAAVDSRREVMQQMQDLADDRDAQVCSWLCRHVGRAPPHAVFRPATQEAHARRSYRAMRAGSRQTEENPQVYEQELRNLRSRIASLRSRSFDNVGEDEDGPPGDVRWGAALPAFTLCCACSCGCTRCLTVPGGAASHASPAQRA